MAVPFLVVLLADHPRPTRWQGSGGGPPPQDLRTTGQPPNEVYSWDITKLLGPAKWTWFYLYVLIDIYSRYVPGWMLAHAENAKLAEALLADTATKQGITAGQLTIHADRGSPMAAKPVAFLLASLGVTKSHSRPHCSNDNPYSESQFRTMKYRPEFPDRFGSFQDAHAFCGRFFRWYNQEHRHSGIGFHTPADVHYSRAEVVRARASAGLSSNPSYSIYSDCLQVGVCSGVRSLRPVGRAATSTLDACAVRVQVGVHVSAYGCPLALPLISPDHIVDARPLALSSDHRGSCLVVS
jgi:hypothetical protein